MRSRLFAIIMGTASVIALFVALPIVAKLQTRRTQRDTYAEAFDQAKSSPSQALGAIERCLEFRPDDLDLHRLGASVALRVGDAALAEKYFAPLLEKAEPPFPAQAHLSLGALYFSGGAKTTPDPSRAIEHFLACLRLDKSQVMATTGIAFAFASQGKLKEATPYLQKVASLPSSAALGQYASTARLWLFSDMFENGDPLACWVAFRRLDLAPSVKGKYERPLKAAVAAKVNSPGISSAVRRVSLLALRDLLRDSATTAAQKLVLNTLMADACDRIGDEAAALTRYRAAYDIDASNDTAARNVAFALLRASQRARRARGHKPKDGLNDFDTAVTIYKDLLTAGKLDEKERRQVVLALATRAWNDDRRPEARKMLGEIKDLKALEVQRMDAAEAIETGDYRKAIAHLTESLKLDESQADVQTLLAGFQRPPLIHDLKASRSSKFDPRPIFSATIAPRSAPIPIKERSVELQLDGKPETPIVTRSGAFYQPKADLSVGEHTLTVSATDALDLKGTATLTFEVAKDAAPPGIIALVPAPDKDTGTLEPIIAFRCTDPSGINEASVKVIFDGKLKRKSPTTRLTIIDRGAYRVAFTRARIKRGARVPYGAGYFRFSEPLLEGEKYTVRVSVSDLRSNRATREWTFTATRGDDDAPEAGMALRVKAAGER